MDLNSRIAVAARSGGYLGDLTTEQADLLQGRGHARHVATTGRWVLTDAGTEAARQVEAGRPTDEP